MGLQALYQLYLHPLAAVAIAEGADHFAADAAFCTLLTDKQYARPAPYHTQGHNQVWLHHSRKYDSLLIIVAAECGQ